jgi:Family of unknown function (DUF6270)
MGVSILGSCITRDVFRLFPDEADVASYHSRSSLISLMAPPFEVDDSGTTWPSSFARKAVIADFRKTFFDDLEAAAPDVLIIDLMSERFDLFRVPGTYVTRSWELLSSGFQQMCGYRLERISREALAMDEAWLVRSREFAGVLRERFPALPVILHKAYWTPFYRDGSTVLPFPRDRRRSIARRNELLVKCHAHLERLLPDVITVEPRGSYVADPSHRWGLGSSHYEHGYYDDVREQFRAAFRRRTTPVAA